MFILREYTNKLMEAMDNGSIDPKDVAEMCLMYMSERGVKDMCQDNDLFQEDDEDAEGSEGR